jgi:hypothetical protein
MAMKTSLLAVQAEESNVGHKLCTPRFGLIWFAAVDWEITHGIQFCVNVIHPQTDVELQASDVKLLVTANWIYRLNVLWTLTH